jgi:hypothetical protein
MPKLGFGSAVPAKVVCHGHYVAFQMAEAAVSRQMFKEDAAKGRLPQMPIRKTTLDARRHRRTAESAYCASQLRALIGRRWADNRPLRKNMGEPAKSPAFGE